MTLITAEDAPEYTRQAADKLNRYIEAISGTKLPTAINPNTIKTPAVLWVGAHSALNEKHPNIDFTLNQPEETLIQTAGRDLVVIGRDIVKDDGVQMEAGTYQAVSVFLEDHLGVRWLWPGKYGTDIPKTSTIKFDSISTRYTPQIQRRRIRWVSSLRRYDGFDKPLKERISSYIDAPQDWAIEKDEVIRDFLNNHHIDHPQTGTATRVIAGSRWLHRNGHTFSNWYAKYGKEHPDWFALQPDGTRTPYPKEKTAKVDISNPEVLEEWMKINIQYLKENPHVNTAHVSVNDNGWEGYCTCENCLAWDNPNAPILEREIRWKNESKKSYALTDRYGKFVNIVAKRLKEEFPDRDIHIATYAYHVTRPAPTIPMEENVIPEYVGVERRSYFSNNKENTLEQHKIWENWWKSIGKQNKMFWRPNINIYAMGLPYIFTERHANTMHFLADHGLAGIEYDAGGEWATQAPQMYLMTKLAWNPRADKDEILDDYYQRAFGPAAPHIREYFSSFEELYSKLSEQYKDVGYHMWMDPPRLFREIRLDDKPATARLGLEGLPKHRHYEKNAQKLLAQAAESVADSDQIYRDRVQFIQTGFDFIQAQLDVIEGLNEYHSDKSETGLKQAQEAAEKREAILKSQIGTFAIDEFGMLNTIYGRRAKYLAPPAKKESRTAQKGQ